MRPVSVFANGPDSEIERLRAELRGPWRQATRAVMVLLSLHELPPAQIAGLLECRPGTARRWIARFSQEGLAGLAGRPRCGRPALGGRRLTRRIAALPDRPGPWTLPRIRRYLSWPQVSPRTLCRRVRLVAIWRRPKLTARGDPYSPHDNPVERIWGALKNYVASTAVTWPGRLRQIHSFSRNRSPGQMLDTAAPWTSPWLPPGYAQNLRNGA